MEIHLRQKAIDQRNISPRPTADPCHEHKEIQNNCKECIFKSERSLRDTFEEKVLYNSLSFHKSKSLDTGYMKAQYHITKTFTTYLRIKTK